MATRVDIDLTLSDDGMDVDSSTAQEQAEASLRAFGARKHVQPPTQDELLRRLKQSRPASQTPALINQPRNQPSASRLPNVPSNHQGIERPRSTSRSHPRQTEQYSAGRAKTPVKESTQAQQDGDSSDDSLVELALSFSAAKKRADELEERLRSKFQFRQQPLVPGTAVSNKRKRQTSTSSEDSVAGPALSLVEETSDHASTKPSQRREDATLAQQAPVVQWPGTMAALKTSSAVPDGQDHFQPMATRLPAFMPNAPRRELAANIGTIQQDPQQVMSRPSSSQSDTPQPGKGRPSNNPYPCKACSEAEIKCTGGTPCQSCRKRHVACRQASQPPAQQLYTTSPGKGRPANNPQSCIACAEDDIKCTGGDPCQNCRKQNVVCRQSSATRAHQAVPAPDLGNGSDLTRPTHVQQTPQSQQSPAQQQNAGEPRRPCVACTQASAKCRKGITRDSPCKRCRHMHIACIPLVSTGRPKRTISILDLGTVSARSQPQSSREASQPNQNLQHSQGLQPGQTTEGDAMLDDDYLPQGQTLPPLPRRPACLACNVAHTKCMGGTPCTRCFEQNIRCEARAVPMVNQGLKRTSDGQIKASIAEQASLPALRQPAMPQHTAAQPTVSQPAMPPLGISQAVVPRPAASQPAASRPALSRPALSRPALSQPAMPQSAVFDPHEAQVGSYFTLASTQQQGFLNSNVFDRSKLAAAARLSRSVLSISDEEHDLVTLPEPPLVQPLSTPRRQASDLNLTPRSGQRDQVKDMRIVELKKTLSSMALTPGIPASAEEDELCDLLKDYVGMTWAELGTHFPHRHTWHSLQTRYSARSRARRGIPVGKASLLKSTEVEDTIMHRSYADNDGSSAEDVSMSDVAAPVPRRPKRAAAEAVKQGVYRISRNHEGFGTLPDDYEDSAGISPEPTSRPRSAMPKQHETSMIQHTVTPLPFGTRKQLSQHSAVEVLRDSAALSAMMYKVHRAPYTEQRVLPRQTLVHPRSSASISAPYLSYTERQQLSEMVDTKGNHNQWDGKALHVDFTDEEIRIIEPCMCQVIMGTMLQPDKPLRQWVVDLMASANEQDIKQIVRYVQSSGKFIKRTTSSLESFLRDLVSEQYHPQPMALRLASRHTTSNTFNHYLGRRELGLGARQSAGMQLKQKLLQDTFGPSYVFKKASSDVTNVAWSSNGNVFAAGATALMDGHSMQYNRRNNLLIGDITSGRLSELPAHAIRRVPTDTGANASHAMNQSQDPLLYTTISAVKFSPDGKAMLTAGYDNMARVWDINDLDEAPTQRWQFRHKAHIDLLEVTDNGALFATGSKQASASIKVLRYGERLEARDLMVANFASEKANKKEALGITPSALRWGPTAGSQDRYLVAGFSSAGRDAAGEGETCIWDIETQQLIACRGGKTVFDIAWSPSYYGIIAIAGSPTNQVNKGTRSTVRIYDSERTSGLSDDERSSRGLSLNSQRLYELECPALDMNDVIFNSGDPNLVTTGCTDGRVYIWDLRRPDQILHCFAHGKSLVELDQTQPAEALDTGIRFISWDESRRSLFSGSSDGVVALWDPYRSPEDAHIRNIIQLGSGVMSGAFSPDFSNLLLGEEDGTVTMLSVGHEDSTMQDCPRFDYREADKETFDIVHDFCNVEIEDDGNTEGIDAAKALLASGEIELAPLAGFPRGQAVQGPNYKRSLDYSEETVRLRRQAARFQRHHKPHDDECQLEHALPLLTEEETGDSGAWKQRIPDAIRSLAQSCRDSVSSVVHKKLDCFHCHSAKLGIVTPKPDIDILGCHVCWSAWRVDVLGFTPVDFYTGLPKQQPTMDAVEQIAKGLADLDVGLDDD